MPRHYSDWLGEYLKFASTHSEAPKRFHLWTGVSTIAGALRRRVWIDQLNFQWTPNFYILLIGPAGVVTKSTTMKLGMSLLERLPDVHMGPESMTWQALGEALEESGDVFEYPTGTKTIISCATLAVSEAGTLLKLDDDGLVSMLIDMWEGQKSIRPWQHKTRSQKIIEIRNPWLNIIGCTTPTWLRSNFPEEIVGGGLVSRILFVYGEKKSQLIAYPSQHWAANVWKETRDKLTSDLMEIGQLKGPFTLSREAIEWGEAWYEQVQTNRPAHLAHSRFDPYNARKQTHLHKLAMVLAASESDCDMTIQRKHLIKADIMLTDVEGDMIKVFESIGMVEEARQRNELEQMVRIHGTITIEALFLHCSVSMNAQSFNNAVISGLNSGIFERVPSTTPNSRFSLKLGPASKA
jgi:hypothetical protein